MTFTDSTAVHLASLASYYADKASRNYADAIWWRLIGAYPASVKHHAEVAAYYSESARFYRERLTEWLDGADERAARWKLAA